MKPLSAIFSARFRLLLQYRAAALAGLTTQIMWGCFITMGLGAFYASSKTQPPMSLGQMITYVWLGQALWAMLPWSGDAEIRQLVRSGNVAYELVRPIDLYAYWFARAMAMRSAPVLLRAVPLIVVAMLFFGLEPPASAAHGAAFLFCLVGGFALSAAITVLIDTSLFWTISGEGVTQIMPIVVLFFSGNILPLPLFPDWAQPVLAALPFRGIIDAPFRIYTGHLPLDRLGGVLLHQWLWVAALVAAGRWTVRRGLRLVVVQGG